MRRGSFCPPGRWERAVNSSVLFIWKYGFDMFMTGKIMYNQAEIVSFYTLFQRTVMAPVSDLFMTVP